MKWLDWAVAVGVAGLAAAIGVQIFRAPGSLPPGPPKVNSQAVHIPVGHALSPDFRDSSPLPSYREHGIIQFIVPEGRRILGLNAAMLFPITREGRIGRSGVEVRESQVRGELHLDRWLARVKAVGPRYLHFVLCLDADGTREFRSGWTRLDLEELHSTGVAVRAVQGCRTMVRLRTPLGQPIPNVLVVVDPAPLTPGEHSHYGLSNEAGELWLSGLEPNRDWSVRLPQGVGGRGNEVARSLKTPCEAMEIEVPLKGRWKFFSIPVRTDWEGRACPVEGVSHKSREAPAAWLTTNILMPGLGESLRLGLMFPDVATLPDQVDVKLGGIAPIAVPLDNSQAVLEISGFTAKVVERSDRK